MDLIAPLGGDPACQSARLSLAATRSLSALVCSKQAVSWQLAPRRRPASADGSADAAAPRGAAPNARSRLGAPPAPAPAVEDAPPRVDGARVVGLPGHLRRVELVDFMCHRHLALDFAPHVTLISGANGSGKSATLQALQCALGARAARTGRAAAAKGFVREGAAEAIVRVTLWNRPYKGHDAFQHELYGDEITVERRIAASGQGSAWALKDARGRRVGARRADLDALLCTLALNAKNPVTVMTQDTARSFLAGSSAGAPPPLSPRSLCLQLLAHAAVYYNLFIIITPLDPLSHSPPSPFPSPTPQPPTARSTAATWRRRSWARSPRRSRSRARRSGRWTRRPAPCARRRARPRRGATRCARRPPRCAGWAACASTMEVADRVERVAGVGADENDVAALAVGVGLGLGHRDPDAAPGDVGREAAAAQVERRVGAGC